MNRFSVRWKIIVIAILLLLVAASPMIMPDYAAFAAEGDLLYGVNSADDGLSIIDPVSGAVSLIGPLHPDTEVFTTPIAMAVRPSDQTIFVWNNSDGSGQEVIPTGVLLTVDPCSGLATEVDPSTPAQGQLAALAFSPAGDLFGVDTDLWTVGTDTGARTLLGSLGSALRIGGADFDGEGTLYGVELTSNQSQRLVTINTNTGAATVIGDLSEDIGVIGSIVFDDAGILTGSGFGGPNGSILFDINPSDGTVSNIRVVSGGSSPQGMGFAPACNLVVTNTNDSGPGSLRQAILNANARPGTDAIEFSITGTGPHTIQLRSALPEITAPVVIDGTTQPGFSGSPIIELDGSQAGTDGLHITGGNSTVRGLVINRFSGNGILIEINGGNTVEGSYIGTDPIGAIDLGNGLNGIQIIDSPNNLISGSTAGERNLISGNGGEGVRIDGANAAGNSIQGNYIGTDASGSADLGNALSGVYIRRSPANQVIGNLISGNDGFAGVAICGNVAFCGGGDFGNQTSKASGNIVQGNLVGTDASGSAALGNSQRGVSLDGTPNTLVGGTTPAERNVISGNVNDGVTIIGEATGNLVQGNYVGTDVTGSIALGNGLDGVRIIGPASGNTVGGTTLGAGNLISANGDRGVTLELGASGNFVQGNYIGTSADGTTALANSFHGVLIADSANNTVSAGNLISGNTVHGVSIEEHSGQGDIATGNVVQGNQIGTDSSGVGGLGNGDTGVFIFDAPANLIGGLGKGEANVIAANALFGVEILGSPGLGNQVHGNFIGTDFTQSVNLGNLSDGVHLFGASNTEILNNVTAFSGRDGVRVEGSLTTGNTVSQNSIHDNFFKGIENLDGGNAELTPPEITTMLGDHIAGTAPPGSTVEIFANADGEGRRFLESVQADGVSGEFSSTVQLSGPNLSATATDSEGNTSEFSRSVAWAPDTCEVNDIFDQACDIAAELGFGFSSAGSFQSWVSSPGDVDWFTFELPTSVEPGSLVTLTLSGAGGGDLPANFDLVVLAELEVDPSTGATPLQGVPLQGVPLQGVPLQGVPLQGVSAESVPLQGVPLQGVPLQGVPLQGVPLQGVPLQGVPLQGVPLQGVPLQGVGFHSGTQPEEVATLFRGGMTGTYFIMVWSSTGEYSTGLTSSPYEVTVSVEDVSVAPCETPLFTSSLYGPSSPASLSGPLGNISDPTSLILTNIPRMEAAYPGEVSGLLTDLQTLAAHPQVNGVIVDLGAETDITDAYAAWDASGCDPEQANLVTLAIKNEILDLLSTSGWNIQDLVMIGNDLIIPMRRVPDGVVRTPDGATVPNEFDYQSTFTGTQYIGVVATDNNPTLATLKLQYYLSDDFYADLAPVLLESGYELSVPDLPIGRLVETPEDMRAHIQVFLANGGIMASGTTVTSLTTGYSFLIDGANAIDAAFGAKGLSTSSLISDLWAKSDFFTAYGLNGSGPVPQIDAVNAHFDHFQFAPAVFDTVGPYVDPASLVNTADFQASLAEMAGTLFFSAGCHLGFNFWDGDATGPGTNDWPQVLVGRGVSLVGNWGFGYGDDAAIAYSEELMVNFAQHLGNSGVGEALVAAKREYLLNQALLDPVHEKILMEAVFYGLPMWDVSAPGGAPGPSGISASISTGTEGGLTIRDTHITLDTDEPVLVTDPDGRGSYFGLAGRTQAAHFRPVQPQASLDVGIAAGEIAHGVLFLGATYVDTPGFDPIITTPSWTQSILEPQFVLEGWDPIRFWSLAQLEGPGGNFDERLVILPGQFQTDVGATQSGGTTVGTERLYDNLDFRIFYGSASAEFQPPIILSVNGAVTSNAEAFFAIDVEDPPDGQGATSGILRVVVTYTEEEAGSAWQSVDLTFNPASGLWEGSISATGAIDFFVQAVDGAGNVGMFAGNGYFTPIFTEVTGPSIARIGEEVPFSVEFPEDLSEPNVLWEFGDGAVAEGSSLVLHTYTTTGTFTVRVRVIDVQGQIGITETQILVVVSAIETLDETREIIQGLEDEDFEGPARNHRRTLLKKLDEVEKKAFEGDFQDAINKLMNDVRSKMDGCGSSPDTDDWIANCEVQITLQSLIDFLISEFELLL